MIEFKNNPFEAGHIKNYILLYAAIVTIMVLFFFASDLWIEPQEVEKKVFDTHVSTQATNNNKQKTKQQKPFTPKFQLLKEGY